MKQANRKYYDWLISQIHIPNNKLYYDVFERLHNTEFIWSVPNDDNRVEDGLDLRFIFGYSRKAAFEKGVSVLEVLIALSRRCAFVGDSTPENWAWHLFENLHLHKLYDPLTPGKANKADEILQALIWRTYKPNGQGGFFPLKHPTDDQTKVEIWYQMNLYIMENQE